ncbi:MAG: hypothetical protein KatS3mg009_0448 [Acidimicrobiia bacterium]|nr:MAG: hypothetical protein KatS3mg009_0448 [Acidimicrobiia bacterium]
MSGTSARGRLEELGRDECLALLARHHLGRLAVVVGGRPLVFPVNYCLDGDRVVFRTDAGTKLHGALGGPVAFEIDGVDGLYHGGWSVLVVGEAEEVADGAERDRLARLPLGLWAGGDRSHWVRIRPAAVTGRRLRTPRPDP